MLNNNLKYPAFDTLELMIDLEFNAQTYTKLKPAKPGDFIDGLSTIKHRDKWHPFFDENIYNQTGVSFSYTKKPLVLYFYSSQWGATGINHLKQLNTLQQQIQYNYGNLLVITDNADDIKQALWDHSLSLQFYDDAKHELSQLLGIYSESSPAWNRYAGIDQNVPLPSVYVLDSVRQVAFAHANEDLLTGLPLNYITEAVYQSNKYLSNKRSA
jgi:peroxiredoxin